MKEQEVQESKNSESGSDDHGTPSASPFLLKLTITPFCADFFLEWILGSSNAKSGLSYIMLKNGQTYF